MLLSWQLSLTQALKKEPGGTRLWHLAKTLQKGVVTPRSSVSSREPGPGGLLPRSTTPKPRTHWFSSSSQRGLEEHGVVKVTVVDTEGWGLVLGAGLGSTGQPSPETFQCLAMCLQVGAMVPSGLRQSSCLLLVQVPGK